MHDELLALVNDEELTLNRCLLPEEFHKPLKIANALRAVMELEEKVTKTMTSTMEALKNSGYNQALADVRQEIEGEMK